MEGDGKFGKVSLGSICDKCTLDSENISTTTVCCSARQLWEAFRCAECGVQGLVNISVHYKQLAIFHWDEKNPIVQIAMREPPRGPFG